MSGCRSKCMYICQYIFYTQAYEIGSFKSEIWFCSDRTLQCSKSLKKWGDRLIVYWWPVIYKIKDSMHYQCSDDKYVVCVSEHVTSISF